MRTRKQGHKNDTLTQFYLFSLKAAGLKIQMSPEMDLKKKMSSALFSKGQRWERCIHECISKGKKWTEIEQILGLKDVK